MAEIHLCSECREAGPDFPGQIGAILRDRAWPGGGTVKVLYLFVGRDIVEIWPADPEQLRELGNRLLWLAAEQEWKEPAL
jgi:hypothetical protein